MCSLSNGCTGLKGMCKHYEIKQPDDCDITFDVNMLKIEMAMCKKKEQTVLATHWDVRPIAGRPEEDSSQVL